LSVVDQFSAIERGLPEGWSEAFLQLTVEADGDVERAAALLAPANPGLFRNTLRFTVVRRGGGTLPEAARRLLRRIAQEGIDGKLELLEARAEPVPERRTRETLRAQWERALAMLPPDWSDIYAEVKLDSTDYLERTALLLAPLNPAHYSGPTSLRFRSARRFGYGVSPEMAARSLERCDVERITGQIEILHVLSDTNPVATQGPVWLVGGRSV
jgi:hypothetical protein